MASNSDRRIARRSSYCSSVGAAHDREHHYKSVDSYWSNWVKQAALTSFPGVSYHGRGRGYVYDPED